MERPSYSKTGATPELATIRFCRHRLDKGFPVASRTKYGIIAMVRLRTLIAVSLSSLLSLPVAAHDPFTGLHNAQGTTCCSSEGPSSDCKATMSRIDSRGH